MTPQTHTVYTSRPIARSLGLKRFISDKPCDKHGVYLRYTCDNQCVECCKEKLRKRYAENTEREKLRSSQYSKKPEQKMRNAERTREKRKVEPDRFATYDKTKYQKIMSDPLRKEKERLRNKERAVRRYRSDPEKYRLKVAEERKDPAVRDRERQRSKQYKAEHPEVQSRLNRKHSPLRRAAKLKRTPPWLTDDHFKEMEKIYGVAKVLGAHVDHIVPLRGKLVSGLHVPWNLQLLTPTENLVKRNKFEV